VRRASQAELRQLSDSAVERGVAFLLARQSGDGLWRDFLTLAGEAAEWTTGAIAAELVLADADREPLERAGDALVAAQHGDGGWGYHAGVPTDADSTACVLLFLAALGRCGAFLERAVACLAAHQDASSGGVATYREPGPIRRYMGLSRETDLGGWCAGHLEVTATAGRAFTAAHAGGEADSAWRYVRSRQRADGSWASYWWTSPLREQGDDGGWSAPGAPTSAFATALALSVLIRAGKSGAHVDRSTERLFALQDADGGWPSHPTMRIPPPGLVEPDSHDEWRTDALGTGVVIRDQHRTFTSALCLGALARAGGRPG
jgi:hypothetical protein